MKFHLYIVRASKFGYSHSTNETEGVGIWYGTRRQACDTRESVASFLDSNKDNCWLVLPFLIDYYGEDGLIIDPYFKKHNFK